MVQCDSGKFGVNFGRNKYDFMDKKEQFRALIEQGYTCKGDSLVLGAAMYNGECLTGAHIRIPLRTMNRHGLIAGATGTGKTKTLQVISEELSEKGRRRGSWFMPEEHVFQKHAQGINEIVKQDGALNCCTWTIKNV